MPSLMPTGKQQFFIPGTAIPLVGGKLYTYIAGTSSLKTTWQDAAGTIPNTNPITLDSTGSALVFWTGNYKIVLKDSLGNTVYTVDNYNTDLAAAFQASVASPAGSSIVGFVQAGAGAAARPLQDKARELVSITDYGANEEADDNAAAINKAIIYMQSVGGELLIPGQFRTSANHQIDGAGGIVSVLGNGPAASKLIATGANTPLTITGASECAVRSVGFDKVTRDQAGGNGLRIINTAYAVVDHVTAYGFLNGIKTEAVLTTLLTKVLTRFCDIGMYLARGDASCPNAITLLNCSSSLNNRFALRADEAASLLVLGGSMEGNGWGTQAIADGFHGGIYLSNCGTEGGVGINILGVHMEQNQGKADIHIATTKNPGTVYNVQNTTIFPIDNVHFTDNAIYVENNVDVVLNVFGNSFKHIGTYTPNASRKYINTEAPLQLTVNTCGDSKQFYSDVQTPDLGAWGPNVYRGSMFSARCSVNVTEGGVASIKGKPYNISNVIRNGPGEVVCVFVKPMIDDDYQVSITPALAAKTDAYYIKAAASVTIQTRDLTGSLIDCPFDLMVGGGV